MRTILSLFVLCFSSSLLAQENVDRVVIVLDNSGSMENSFRGNRDITKMSAAKTALSTVIDGLTQDSHLGVVLLNAEGDPWLIPLGAIDKDSAKAKIGELSPGGGTPLGPAMKSGCDVLLAERAQQRYGRYRVLIVTDGEADNPTLVERYLSDILSRGIVVDVIGVDMANTHALATQVAEGRYRSADDPGSLQATIQEVLAEGSSDPDIRQEDYELAAAFPAEVAEKVLLSLTNSGNHPVGETPQVVVQEDGTVTAADEGGLSWFVWTLLGVAILIVLIGFGKLCCG